MSPDSSKGASSCSGLFARKTWTQKALYVRATPHYSTSAATAPLNFCDFGFATLVGPPDEVVAEFMTSSTSCASCASCGNLRQVPRRVAVRTLCEGSQSANTRIRAAQSESESDSEEESNDDDNDWSSEEEKYVYKRRKQINHAKTIIRLLRLFSCAADSSTLWRCCSCTNSHSIGEELPAQLRDATTTS
ncbi:hypothetical protein PRIC1_002690 [Phytophthora ramorum]